MWSNRYEASQQVSAKFIQEGRHTEPAKPQFQWVSEHVATQKNDQREHDPCSVLKVVAYVLICLFAFISSQQGWKCGPDCRLGVNFQIQSYTDSWTAPKVVDNFYKTGKYLNVMSLLNVNKPYLFMAL